MLDRTTPPNFIDITPEADLEMLKSKYEMITETTLAPAQFENILISLMVYYMNLQKLKFNDAARLNLPQFSRAPFLDFIGEMFNCTRLKSEYGYSTLQINLKEAFNDDLTIDLELEVQSKDEKYLFTTTEDLVIPAGELSGQIQIKSELACSAVNNYGIGDVNILLKPFSYIESVTNVTPVTNGADEETDEAYIERILESAEGFSCAGSRGAYEYFTKSAHPDIVDCCAKCIQNPASITYSGETVNAIGNTLTGENFTASVDYFTGEMSIVLNPGDNQTELKVTIPPAATVSIYPLTRSGELTETVKQKVEEVLDDETIRPMTDYVVVLAPEKVSQTKSITFKLYNNADLTSTTEAINNVLAEFAFELRKSLGKSFVFTQLMPKLSTIAGIYRIIPDSYDDIEIQDNQFLDLTFASTVEFEEE